MASFARFLIEVLARDAEGASSPWLRLLGFSDTPSNLESAIGLNYRMHAVMRKLTLRPLLVNRCTQTPPHELGRDMMCPMDHGPQDDPQSIGASKNAITSTIAPYRQVQLPKRRISMASTYRMYQVCN
jgi:hypothetical protein